MWLQLFVLCCLFCYWLDGLTESAKPVTIAMQAGSRFFWVGFCWLFSLSVFLELLMGQRTHLVLTIYKRLRPIKLLRSVTIISLQQNRTLKSQSTPAHHKARNRRKWAGRLRRRSWRAVKQRSRLRFPNQRRLWSRDIYITNSMVRSALMIMLKSQQLSLPMLVNMMWKSIKMVFSIPLHWQLNKLQIESKDGHPCSVFRFRKGMTICKREIDICWRVG